MQCAQLIYKMVAIYILFEFILMKLIERILREL